MESSQKKSCPCCGYLTIDIDSNFDICPVCFWESNPIQDCNEDYEGGANNVSLNQARINFLQFGAIEKKLVGFVRQPLKNEIKQI